MRRLVGVALAPDRIDAAERLAFTKRRSPRKSLPVRGWAPSVTPNGALNAERVQTHQPQPHEPPQQPPRRAIAGWPEPGPETAPPDDAKMDISRLRFPPLHNGHCASSS